MGKLVGTSLAIGLAVGLVGCGTSGPVANATPSAPAQTPTPPSSPAPSAATPAAAAGGFVRAGQATIGGSSVTILTDATGRTLYYFKRDSATSVACTAGCATTWPPLHVSGTPTAPELSGRLSVLAGPNGPQVLYNGHPLYRYAADSAPGDAKGQGIGGNWFVATPDLPVQT